MTDEKARKRNARRREDAAKKRMDRAVLQALDRIQRLCEHAEQSMREKNQDLRTLKQDLIASVNAEALRAAGDSLAVYERDAIVAYVQQLALNAPKPQVERVYKDLAARIRRDAHREWLKDRRP